MEKEFIRKQTKTERILSKILGTEYRKVAKPVSVTGATANTGTVPFSKCGKTFKSAKCNHGHKIIKRLYCHFDGCPTCGRPGSEAHRGRMSAIRDKVLSMRKPVYVKVKIDEMFFDKISEDYSNRIFKLLRNRLVLNFKYKAGNGLKYIMRWTFFEGIRFDPTLHILIDAGHIREDDVERITINTTARMLNDEFGNRIKHKSNRTYRKYVKIDMDILWMKTVANMDKASMKKYIDFEHIEKAIESATAPAITPEAYAIDPAVANLIKGVNMVSFHAKVDLEGTLAGEYLKIKEEAFKNNNPKLYNIYKGLCPCCGNNISWGAVMDDEMMKKEMEGSDILPVKGEEDSKITANIERNGGRYDFYVVQQKDFKLPTAVYFTDKFLQNGKVN